ncbi:hypothetical protein SteCoe_32709 [Stentor coeruleus]|uniref:Palmitoyltransferase n=1 Tax=Stentor coeruleus TaxID=5963 RepID=A0A1R2AYG8_9CILI|nr:hypothetical protein SteCoe_32709 [Stentor coeruleus]
MEEVHSKVLIKRPTFTTLGNCHAVFINNKLVLLIGPHWPFMFCVIPMIIAVLVGYLTLIAEHMEVVWQFGGVCIILLALVSYSTTALKDPGVVLSDSTNDLDEDTTGSTSLCRHCLIFKDNETEHCEDCGLCMRGLDHHCIFTGKCIAEKNIFCFYTMLTSIFGFFIYTMLFLSEKFE